MLFIAPAFLSFCGRFVRGFWIITGRQFPGLSRLLGVQKLGRIVLSRVQDICDDRMNVELWSNVLFLGGIFRFYRASFEHEILMLSY